MATSHNFVRHIALHEVKKVIDALGEFSEGILYTYSLALIINKTGEATFSSSGSKLLEEIGCSCPLSKVISNAAKNYTSFCGDDCKYFLFILKEVFNAIYNNINKGNDLMMRREIMNEICSLKLVLPCIFKSIQNLPCGSGSGLDPFSFSKDLNSVVLTFMLSRFSVGVSKILSSLICDFIQNVCEVKSLQTVLAYVISHFDIFCCKILSPLSQAQVINGFLFYTKHIPSNLNLENVNFIIVWDLTMKVVAEDAIWKIKDESFFKQLNPMHMYAKFFDYFKSLEIRLIFTPSTCGENLKLLSKKNNIVLFDKLEMEDINHFLTCFQIYPLESLNESIETKHIGKLKSAKSLSFNKSHFLHLKCVNSTTFLKAHHILLSAPCNAIWKEYYSECLNCIKMILQWLSSKSSLCLQEKFKNEVPEGNNEKEAQLSNFERRKGCDMCSEIKLKFENLIRKAAYLGAAKSNVIGRVLLPPCSWELLFKTALEKVAEQLASLSSIVLPAVHLAVSKSICKRIGVSFAAVKDIEKACDDFIEKCNLCEVMFLEPVACKEIMINNVLDLILQLLKIDSIVFVK